MDFAVLVGQSVKIEDSEKIAKYLDLAWELKKALKHERDCDTNWN